MQQLSASLKKELVLFVLERCPVWHFNQTITSFSIQKLYARYKRDLMRAYPDLMNGNLNYAIVMAEAFAEYKCCEVECPSLKFKIDNLKARLRNYPKYHSGRVQIIEEHNALVDEYMKLLEPQQKLIALYKKVCKTKLLCKSM